jgi:hypothetical protein
MKTTWLENTFIEVKIPVLVDRHELPKMSDSEEMAFKRELSDILGAWLPGNDEWLEAVNLALKNAGLNSIYHD